MIALLAIADAGMAVLTQRQVVSAAALLSGGIVTVVGLVALQRARLPAPPATPADPGRGGSAAEARQRWLTAGALLVVVALGAWLRLDDLAAKTLTHTEAILPNLRWPPDSWPPTRTSFYDTFWWHYHSEPHPPAHYFLIWGWTKLFGTGLFSLRAPSALFGIGSIGLTYWLGARTFDRRVGLLAAALIALNGFHIYFSQYARVFMMGTFLALLSTLLLLRIRAGAAYRWRWEAAYVGVSALALYTQTFHWLVLAMHMMWTALQLRGPEALIRRLVALQSLAVMLGAPALAHLLYRGDRVDLPGPSIEYAAEYLSFGFLLLRDDFSIPARAPAPLVFWALALFASALLVAGATLKGRPPDATGVAAAQPAAPLPAAATALVAAGTALMTLGLVIVSLRRQMTLGVAVAAPLFALSFAPLYGTGRAWLTRRFPALRDGSLVRWLERATSLSVLLAFVPPLLLMLLSVRSPLLTPRAFLIFVPYLLVLAAAGTLRLGRSRAILAVLLIVLGAAHVASVSWFRAYPSEEFDYAALGAQLNEQLRSGDMLLVPPSLWVVTPLYYYLEGDAEYVTRDYAEAVTTRDPARVWTLEFDSRLWGEYRTTTPEMTDALSEFRRAGVLAARRARAVLHVRD